MNLIIIITSPSSTCFDWLVQLEANKTLSKYIKVNSKTFSNGDGTVFSTVMGLLCLRMNLPVIDRIYP